MVKHGHNKKRRAGRIGKTKLKSRTWSRWDPDPKVNSVLKPHWDPSKTPSANLANLGLRAHPNQVESGTASTSRGNSVPTKGDGGAGAGVAAAAAAAVIELFDVPDSDAPSRRSKFPLEADEELYIAACLQKWGDCYPRMFRDTKINTLQHTEERLRKLAARFLLLSAAQRRVEVPENVIHLIRRADQDSL